MKQLNRKQKLKGILNGAKILFALCIILSETFTIHAQSSVNSTNVTPLTVTQPAAHSPNYNNGVSEGTFSIFNYNITGSQSFSILGIEIWDDDIDQTQTIPAIINSIMNRNSEDIILLQEHWSEEYHDAYVIPNYDSGKYPYKTDFTTKTRDEASMIMDYLAGEEYFLTYRGDGLWRFSKRPLSEPLRWKYSDCEQDDCRAKKGFSMSVQKVGSVQGRDVYVHVYNTHMQSGRTEEKNAVRKVQLAELLDAIEYNSVRKGFPVVVAGDFNTSFYRDDVEDDDDFIDFANNTFSNGRQLKDLLYTMKGWAYDAFEGDRTAGQQAGEGIEHCFFMNSDDVELIPVEFNDLREDFGGSRTQNSDGSYETGWSGHPPLRYAFSFATNYDVCTQYLAIETDFDNDRGAWGNESGDGVTRDENSLRLKGTSKAWTDSWDFSNVGSWYIEYNCRTNSNWDSGDTHSVQYSADGGDSWTTIYEKSGQLSDFTVTTATINTVSPEMMFRVSTDANNDNEKIWFEYINIYVCGDTDYPVQEYEVLSGTKSALITTGYVAPNLNNSVENDFKVYPNPASNYLEIVFPSDNQELFEIQLIDLSGRMLLTEKTYSTTRLGTDMLESGIYLLRIKGNTTDKTQRIVIAE